MIGATRAMSSPATAVEMPSQVLAVSPPGSRVADDAAHDVGAEDEGRDDRVPGGRAPVPRRPRQRPASGRPGRRVAGRARRAGRRGHDQSPRPTSTSFRVSGRSVKMPSTPRSTQPLDGRLVVDGPHVHLLAAPVGRRTRPGGGDPDRAPADPGRQRHLQGRRGGVEDPGEPGREAVQHDPARAGGRRRRGAPSRRRSRCSRAGENELTHTRSYASCSPIASGEQVDRRLGLGVDVEAGRRGRPRAARRRWGSGRARRSGRRASSATVRSADGARTVVTRSSSGSWKASSPPSGVAWTSVSR